MENNIKTGLEKSRLEKKKKLQYGSTAVLFTAVIVALVIIANAVFFALSYNLQWYSDMTSEKMYGISEKSIDLLSDLSSDKINIHIIFCSQPDQLENSLYSRLVHQMAMSYDKAFDFVDVQYYDIITNPSSVEKYMTTASTKIKTTNVIVASDNDFRLFTVDSFYTLDEDDNSVFAFNGEYKITSAILQLSYDNPIAYFTSGHGETVASSLEQLFIDAGYTVKYIDLTKEEIDPNAQVIVINGPRYDFLGFNSEVNEISKIADFLDGYGNLMVFMDPQAMATQSFPELGDFLEEWGISFGQTVLKDPYNAVSTDGFSLVGTYMTDGIAESFTSSFNSLSSAPKSIVRYTMPINILWETKSIDRSTRYVSALLSSTNTTNSYAFTDEETVLETGSFNLLTLSQDSIYIDNEQYTSYVMACGTTYFTSDNYILSNSYGNSDLIFTCMKAMGREKVPLDIDFRVFEDNTLDITQSQANTWTVIFTAFLPIIVIVLGIIVFVKRKNL